MMPPTMNAPTPSLPTSPPLATPATPAMTALATRNIQAVRVLAVVCTLGLIVLGLGWELIWAPLRPGGSTLALKVLPLCIPLAGLLKNRMYTYRWLSMMVWLYFTEGIVRAFSDKPPGNWLAMLEIFLCVILFVACVLHVRLRQRYAKAANAANAEAPTEVIA